MESHDPTKVAGTSSKDARPKEKEYRLEVRLTSFEWQKLERAVTPRFKFQRRLKKSDVIRRLMRRYLEDSYDPDA